MMIVKNVKGRVLVYVFLYPSQTQGLSRQAQASGCTCLYLGLVSVS